MKANELKVGDKIKAGEMVAEIKAVREVVEGHSTSSKEVKTIKYFTVEGQPEIAAWNLQKYIDQGMIIIL